VVGNNDFEGPLHSSIDLSGTGWQEYRFGAFLPYRREHAARRIWAAIRALGHERFDVIHYHGHVYALGAVVPAGVPFVSTLHDQGSECLTLTRFRRGAPCAETDPAACAGCATAAPNALQRWLSATAVERHRHVSAAAFARHETIFVSDFLRRRFEAHARPPQPLRANVVHNFTDSVRIAGVAASGAAPADTTRPVLLMAGRIDATKGFGALLDALPDAVLAGWQVRVVGSGPQLAEVQAHHAARGVVFTGHLSQAQVYAETAAATACVVPSLCEESCATTVFEALALGKPVYALARGGTPELVRYERWPGQLVLESDLAALARRLQTPPLAAAPQGPADAADVRRRLPEILAVYERARVRAAAGAQPARLPHEVTP
jgi:glycosyltransferase involved in cell wall biosynthesis